MKFRQATIAILFSGAALLAPAALSAQFTTFVAPARKAAVDTARPTVAAAKAKADSVARMTLTDMKTWVDSAAGTSTQVANASDTTMAAANATSAPATPGAAPSSSSSTTTFSNGAIAPSTASPLPMYFVLGLASLSAGLLLRRRRVLARARKE